MARSLTAYQHYMCCERLLGDDHDSPDVDDFDGGELLVHALARLAAAARRHECPVLVSRLQDDELSAPVRRLASNTLEYEPTPQGPRFVGEGFETLVYPLGDGWLQTTLAFWNQILEERAAVHPTPITPETVREVA